MNSCFEKELKLAEQIKDLEREQRELNKDIQEVQRQKADALEPELLSATRELKVSFRYSFIDTRRILLKRGIK